MEIAEIWKAIDNNIEVNWNSDLYKIHVVDCDINNKYGKLSFRKGKALRITCKTNYFGSLIGESELKDCYIKFLHDIHDKTLGAI